MFPLENEYKSLLPRNAYGTYKAACTSGSHLRYQYNCFLLVSTLLSLKEYVEELMRHESNILWNFV